jgi:hypothetical protein
VISASMSTLLVEKVNKVIHCPLTSSNSVPKAINSRVASTEQRNESNS